MAERAILSVGTTHPWNIAGVGLDSAIIREYGLRPLTVIAAVSAQDAQGLHALHPVPPEIVAAQLQAIPPVGAVRVGAFGSAANASVIAAALDQCNVPVVVDPVISASLGGELADAGAVAGLGGVGTRPHAVLTPNLDEASALCGRSISTLDEMRQAAAQLRDRGYGAVLVKGGHLQNETVIDVLAYDGGLEIFEDERLGVSMRGTGCTLAAALACELCAGYSIVEAVERARRYVRTKISAQTTFQSLHVPL